jgi:uncharacterized protein (TIGR03067 family)
MSRIHPTDGPSKAAPDNPFLPCSLLALLVALFLFCGGGVTFETLSSAEERGGTVRLNWLFALIYSAFGKKGAVLVFVVPACLALVAALGAGVIGVVRHFSQRPSATARASARARGRPRFVAAPPAGKAGPPDLAQREQEKLQGRWLFVAFTGPMERSPAGKPRTRWATFRGDRMTWETEGDPQPVEFVYTVGARPQPKAIDFALMLEGQVLTMATIQAIYQLTGDTLRLCYDRTPSGGGRPERFEARPHTVLAVLKRQPRSAGARPMG